MPLPDDFTRSDHRARARRLLPLQVVWLHDAARCRQRGTVPLTDVVRPLWFLAVTLSRASRLAAARARAAQHPRAGVFEQLALAFTGLRTAAEDVLGGPAVDSGSVPNQPDPTAGASREIANGMAMLVRASEVFMHAVEHAGPNELGEVGTALWAATGRLLQLLPVLEEHLDGALWPFEDPLRGGFMIAEGLLEPDAPPPVGWPMDERAA